GAIRLRSAWRDSFPDGPARPPHSVGGLRRGAIRLRSAWRDSFHTGPRGRPQPEVAQEGTTRLRPASRLSFQAATRPQRFRSSRTDWNASAYLTRAWMPRKLAHDRDSSRIVRSSMLVFVTWDRWASRLASLRSSTSAMSV